MHYGVGLRGRGEERVGRARALFVFNEWPWGAEREEDQESLAASADEGRRSLDLPILRWLALQLVSARQLEASATPCVVARRQLRRLPSSPDSTRPLRALTPSPPMPALEFVLLDSSIDSTTQGISSTLRLLVANASARVTTLYQLNRLRIDRQRVLDLEEVVRPLLLC